MPTSRDKPSTPTLPLTLKSASSSKVDGVVRGPFELKPQRRRGRSRSEADASRAALRQARQKAASFLDEDDDSELSVDSLEPPRRRYDCPNYDGCLDLAAALNWDSFTCGSCSGQVDEALYWRAHQVRRKDSVARALCELPPIVSLIGAAEQECSSSKNETIANIDAPKTKISTPRGISSKSAMSEAANGGCVADPQMTAESAIADQPANADDPLVG